MRVLRPYLFPAVCGALGTMALRMSRFMVSFLLRSEVPGPGSLMTALLTAGLIGAVVAAGTYAATTWLARWLIANPQIRQKYLTLDAYSYSVFLILLLQEAGLVIHKGIFASMILAFLAMKPLFYYLSLPIKDRRAFQASRAWLCCLFLLSGIAALIYQVTWQRILFRLFGVNSESITMIVSVFMLGLGLGALIGGRLSQNDVARLPKIFLYCEAAIGLYGILSVPLIQQVGAMVLHASPWAIGLTAFLLLLPPTLAMGATLPVLVTYLNRTQKNLGESVGLLYFFNTLGSALACVVATNILFIFLGQQGAVAVAAAVNLTVGWLVSRHSPLEAVAL